MDCPDVLSPIPVRVLDVPALVVTFVYPIPDALPSRSTPDAVRRLLPTTATLSADPTVPKMGVAETNAGVGFVITTSAVELVPPPGVGENTETVCVPRLDPNAGLRLAVNAVGLIKVVGRSLPSQRTTLLAPKPVPSTFRVDGGLVAKNAVGDTEDSTGAGRTIVTVVGADVPPPGVGFTTVIEAVPASYRLAAEIEIANDVGVHAVIETPEYEPFQSTDVCEV